MKKILLVLIALMGIGFSVNAQSCEVGDDTYVAIQATVVDHHIVCKATWNGANTPSSGTVYATVYYINTDGEEDSEMITIDWNDAYANGLLYKGNNNTWNGYSENVQRIKRWEVSAGACRIKKD